MSSAERKDISKRRLARWGIMVLILIFISVALAYSIVNPLHEATDELRHYRFVRIIATTGQLPVQGQEACRSQSHHPPLFYALGALATFWIDTDRDVCYTPPTNPFWAYRYWEVGQDNKNQYLHGEDEAFPWHGEALAAHIIRAINVLIGAGVVWLTWATARVIWPRRAAMALGASAFVAFNPMFLYMAGGINNDIIAAFSGAAVVYACVRLLDAPERLGWRWGVICGALYGLALMSKFNLAPIVLLIVATMAWAAWQQSAVPEEATTDQDEPTAPPRRRWQRALRLWLPAVGMTIAVAAVVAGWWFVRNQLLFGEPTGIQELTELWGVRNPAESFGLAISELRYAWTTLWGRFGFGQIPLPESIYGGLKVVVGAGMLGAVAGFFRVSTLLAVSGEEGESNADPTPRAMLILLAANLLLFFAVLFNYMLLSPAGPNGRFVFPALSSLALLTFYGLSWWVITLRTIIVNRREELAGGKQGQHRAINILGVVTTAGMLALSIWVLFGYLAPAYARPPSLAENVEIPNPVDARFDTLATLLGYEISSDTVQPGGTLDVSLYWRIDNQPPGNYLLFLHLIDSAGTMVAQRDTHPGLGNYPSGLWRPGDQFVDRIRLQVPATAYGPELGTLSIGLYEPDGYRLAISDSAGEPVGDSLTLGEIAIEPKEGNFANPQSQDFANDLLLTGYEYNSRMLNAGDELAVSVHWRALRDIQSDYIVRIRLLDATGHRVASVKHRPVSGELPTTTWTEGQSVTDVFRLDLPDNLVPGRYRVDLAVIDSDAGDPVHILAEDGHQVNSRLPLAEIRVVE